MIKTSTVCSDLISLYKWGKILNKLFIFILLLGWSTAKGQDFNFGTSNLKGITLANPTSLQFGPDGRLYVSQQDGIIKIYTINRNGPNDYSVTATETINLINQIPNHNDDGTLAPGITTRQVTGILVVGTVTNPILYVSSSDSRIGGPSGGGDTNLDTNSGIISRLTWTGSAWNKVDIVRGLPRSEENHSVNGMQLDPVTNKLFVTVAGFTNAGAPCNNFAFITEFALAAAILSIDLNVINALPVKGSGNTAYIYDLPTVDDPTRPNAPDGSDINDPFGGNDGLNQAKIVPGGPVQVYASGFRTPYDLVITKSRKMYATDNGGNQGWGGYPDNEGAHGNVTNNYVIGEPGSNGPGVNDPQINNLDNFHYVGDLDTYQPGSFYGGHPNPIRANPAGAGLYTFDGVNNVWRTSKSGAFPLPADWPPVPLEYANPIEGDFQQPGVSDNALLTFDNSTNGIVEYTASNFNNALKGTLLATNFNGPIVKINLTPDGTGVTNLKNSSNRQNQDKNFASGFGALPLDITAQGDDDIFPGTVWVVTYESGTVVVFEPQDIVVCTEIYSTTLDDDNDGYSNADEIDNQTEPCSASSKPADFDKDFLSNKNDDDDDNDGIPDNIDPFQLDAQNGLATNLPIKYDLFNGNPGTGFFGLGFTGLMSNKQPNNEYQDLFDEGNLIAGGAVGAFSVIFVPEGDALGSLNNQKYAFQFGFKPKNNLGPFTARTTMIASFFNHIVPTDFQSQGFYIGTGDQDNYVKIALYANGGAGGIEVVHENNGMPVVYTYPLSNGLPASRIELFLTVDPQSGTIQPKYAVDGGQEVILGMPIVLTGPLLSTLNGSNALAAGIIATSRGAVEYTATWDNIYISYDLNQAPVANAGEDKTIFLPTTSVDLQGAGTDGDGTIVSYAWTQVSGPNIAIFNNAAIATPNISGLMAGTYVFSLVVTDNNGIPSLPDEVIITVPIGQQVVYRINAGGGPLSGSLGNFSADQFYSPSSTYTEIAPIAGTADDIMYQTERWGDRVLSYDFPVSNGQYKIVLHFAELVFSNSGQRVFDIKIEGIKLIDNYDIVAKAGPKTAVTETFTANVTDRELNIYLSSLAADGGSDNPKVSAIEIFKLTTSGSVPIADAGDDQIITLPVSSVVLNGSGSNAENSISSYSWTQISGPDTASFSNKTIVNPTASNLKAGVYIFGLTVKDENNSTSLLDQVKVTVNPAPVGQEIVYRINAGGGPVNNSIGSFSTDQYFSSSSSSYSNAVAIAGTTNDAIYQTERWGPGVLDYNFPVVNGEYKVILHFAELYFNSEGQRVFDVFLENTRVLDNYDIVKKGGTRTAITETITGNVNDGVLNIQLNSSAQNGGKENPKISAIEIFRLTTSGSAPVANAGQDIVINLADTTVTLSGTGTDQDGTIVGYSWTQVSGPNAATFSNASTSSPIVSGLIEGTYIFSLSVTDNSGLTSAPDQVSLTVLPLNNQMPVANAGVSQTITLPLDSVVLDGSGIDPDGSIVSYSWSQVSGPSAAVFSSTTIDAPTVKSLLVGSYVFNLIVEDNKGLLSLADQVTITVLPAKQAPLANAGEDIMVTLPTNSAILTGSGIDADGTISKYTWSQISGPSAAVFSSTSIANPTVTNLIAGSYLFSLTVEDNDSLSSQPDHVTVVVNPAIVNQQLIYRINAGGGAITNSIGNFSADQYYSASNPYKEEVPIAGTADDLMYQTERWSEGLLRYSLPVQNGQYRVILHFAELVFNNVGQRVFDISLEGTKVFDNYDIVKKVGPRTATTETFTATVTDRELSLALSSYLAEGGKDNPKISAIEVFKINTVGEKPLADAGEDQTIILPTDNVVLQGAGSDNTNTITSYSWTQLSGPSTAVFSNSNIASPTVSGLIAGNYTFSLTVTNNMGIVSDPDQVLITVNPAIEGEVVYRINAGGGALSTSIGNFASDQYYSNTSSSYSNFVSIAGTTDDLLYQTERWGPSSLSYQLPLINGDYKVVLHFAELIFNTTGQRVFDVSIEGTKVLDNYDIVGAAGSLTAKKEIFSTSVADGVLSINFSSSTSEGGKENPKISAIEVIRIASGTSARVMKEESFTFERDNDDLIAAYPNPFSTTVNLKIKVSQIEEYQIKVYDLLGKEVYFEKFTPESTGFVTRTIDFNKENIPNSNMYLVSIENKQGTLRKIVKLIKGL